MSVTTTTSSAAIARPRSRRRSRAVWAVQILLGLFFVVAAVPKLGGQADAVEMFGRIGLGQWLRYLTGVCEIAGGIGLVDRKSIV